MNILSPLFQRLLWIHIPLTFIVCWKALEFTLSYHDVTQLVSENGEVELVHFVIAACASLVALCRTFQSDQSWLRLWFGCFFVGCLFIAGEEISWGQWFFYWESPELFKVLNDQGETNLHNMSSWLDQKPRTLIEMGVVFSGLLLPWMAVRCPNKLPAWVRRVLPPKRAAVLACIYLVVKLLDTMADQLGVRIYARASEIVEMIIYYYLFAYVLTLAPRA